MPLLVGATLAVALRDSTSLKSMNVGIIAIYASPVGRFGRPQGSPLHAMTRHPRGRHPRGRHPRGRHPRGRASSRRHHRGGIIAEASSRRASSRVCGIARCGYSIACRGDPCGRPTRRHVSRTSSLLRASPVGGIPLRVGATLAVARRDGTSRKHHRCWRHPRGRASSLLGASPFGRFGRPQGSPLHALAGHHRGGILACVWHRPLWVFHCL